MLCSHCKKSVKTYKELVEHIIDEAGSHPIGMVKWTEGYLKRPVKKLMGKEEFYKEMREKEGKVSLSQ